MSFLASWNEIVGGESGVVVAWLAVALFATGLVWCGAVQLVRIARSLHRIVEILEKKEQG